MFKKVFSLVLVLGVLFTVSACSLFSVKDSGKTSLLVDEIEDKNLETVPNTEYVYYKGENGKTVLELLENVSKIEKETVEGGVLVTSIDGVKGDDVNLKQWIYYVDGEEMKVLADQYVTKDGQEIEWWYGGKKEEKGL